MLRFKWETPISDMADKKHENLRDIEKTPDRWERRNLGHVAELRREHFLPKDEDTRLYVGLEHIEEGALTLKGVGKSKDVVSGKSVFLKGDILFGKLRPYFRKVILAPFDGVCSTDILVIKPKTKTHNKYLFYLLASRQIIDSVSTASEGTKMPRTSWGFLESIEINFPPYEEQNRIGEVLSWFDCLIENKKRQNEILEKSAMAIFKSWFIDFEPFSKEKSIDTVLGKIPERWAVRMIEEIGEVSGGSTPSTKVQEYWDGDVPWITPNDLADAYAEKITCISHGKRNITRKAVDEYSLQLFPPGTILLTSRAPIGYLAIANNYLATNQGFKNIVPREDFYREFLYLFIRSNLEYLRSIAGGSTFSELTAGTLREVKLVVPPTPILQRFHNLVEPLFQKIRTNQKQIIILRKARDTLLPLLVFGKLRVEEI